MVVDDDEHVRKVAKTMLEQMGHKSVAAKDGEEALELYKKYSDSGIR